MAKKVDVKSVDANHRVVTANFGVTLQSIEELEGVVSELDVAEQVVPTITVPIKLNYSDPLELMPVITPLLSKEGKASADARLLPLGTRLRG